MHSVATEMDEEDEIYDIEAAIKQPGTYIKEHVVYDSGTRYVAYVTHVIGEKGALLIAIETGWGSYYGQWIMLGMRKVHWSYLTEKMPGLRDGDKPGYIKLFAEFGVEVTG